MILSILVVILIACVGLLYREVKELKKRLPPVDDGEPLPPTAGINAITAHTIAERVVDAHVRRYHSGD